jgi:hypothetical protein
MAVAMLCRDFEVSRPNNMPEMKEIYNFTVGPTSLYAMLTPRRSVRGGIDIELRVAERRVQALPIDFPERRIADRRKQTVTSN